MRKNLKVLPKHMALLLMFLTIGISSFAEGEAVKLDTGNTAWVMVAGAMVFFMTPGLAFFYGGMARRSSVLHTMMKSFLAISIGAVAWILIGYTIVFGPEGNAFLGSMKFIGLSGMTPDLLEPTGIPTLIFAFFQGTFAVIAVALISGAIIERTKFISYLLFVVLWVILVYSVTAHWAWSADGWLFKMGVLDLAGGTVIHISAGISAVVAALIIGPRPKKENGPHNIPYVLLGTGILWFGWFGFNAGSVLAANGVAALAVMTTFGASATGFVTWLIWDAIKGKKPSVVGAAIGAVIGLVAITPAASFVTPIVSLFIGFASVTTSYWILLSKEKLPFDDVLDVFACHGIGGIVGALLTGVFAFTTGSGNPSMIKQVGIQFVGIFSIIIYASIMTAIILYAVKAIFGLRIDQVGDENFNYSIDEIIHGELGYGEFTKIKKAEEEGNL